MTVIDAKKYHPNLNRRWEHSLDDNFGFYSMDRGNRKGLVHESFLCQQAILAGQLRHLRNYRRAELGYVSCQSGKSQSSIINAEYNLGCSFETLFKVVAVLGGKIMIGVDAPRTEFEPLDIPDTTKQYIRSNETNGVIGWRWRE